VNTSAGTGFHNQGFGGWIMISILITLVIVGFLLWLVNTYIPMDGKFKQIFNVLAVIVVVLWIIRELGVLTF
jgi:phage-related holin